MPESELLSVDGLSAGYDELDVITDITLSVQRGDIVSILGPNGAGKTTLMRALIGLLTPSAGTICFEGVEVTDATVPERIRAGISLVPEENHVFKDMTVKENLVLSAATKTKDRKRERIEHVYDLFPRLDERRGQRAGTLSGGEAQMLSLGQALVTEPDLLLLDEPSLGLAPALVEQMFDIVGRINEDGVTVVLVEQQVKSSVDISDWVYVLSTGQIEDSGPASEIGAVEEIMSAYLGGA